MTLPQTSIDAWVDPIRFAEQAANLCAAVLEADLTDQVAEAADYFFWMTGFMYPGEHARVVEPVWERCSHVCPGEHWGYRMLPTIVDGHWVNLECGGLPPINPEGVPLHPRPIGSVTAVSLDGVTPLDPGDYDLVKGVVVLADGLEWPEEGAVIDYTAGANPPPWVARAARDYAVELACLDYCPAKCSLPKDWSELRTTHATISKKDRTSASALLGITPNIDRVLAHFLNAKGHPRRPARILTPDLNLDPGRMV